MIDIKHILKDHAYQNVPLSYDEAYQLGVMTLESCSGTSNRTVQIQSIAALCALHNGATYRWRWNERDARIHRHELSKSAAEQIAGICVAVFEHDIGKSRYGFLRPKVPYVIDNCGMGGDLTVTANVSTLAAFIVAAGGVTMCKHGSPANADEGRHGSSDFIELCGINVYATKEAIERCVEKLGFGYTEACDTGYKMIHLQTHKIALLPHMNDIIGPITNPVDPKLLTKRILGVNHLVPPRVVADAYEILNQKRITCLEHGLFVRGFADVSRYEGVDEVSLSAGGTQVVRLRDGATSEFFIGNEEFGVPPMSIEQMIPPNGNKGEYSLEILYGKVTDARADIVLANAAVIFWLDERVKTLKEGYEFAKEILFSGKAKKKMLAVREMLPLKR